MTVAPRRRGALLSPEGIGNALSTQGVEKDFVVPPQLDMLDPLATGQDVEGDVEDLAGLVTGEIPLERMEVVVDGADQARIARQEEHGADAAGAMP
jgi:hypothetical protein